MKTTKLQLEDSFPTIMVKMSEGNPGALNVCMRLFRHNAEIDPDAAMGPISSLLLLDTLNIYGERMWILYSTVCQENLTYFVAALRAFQLSFVSEASLNAAIDRNEMFSCVEALQKVQVRLPSFGKQQEVLSGK